MVGEDLNGKWRSMEVVLPGLQGVDYCKEFPVIYVIIPFGGRE